MRQTKGFKKPKPLKYYERAEVVSTQGPNSTRFRLGDYKTPPGHSGFKRVVRQYKIGAGQRGLPFELSDDEIKALTSANCRYCGAAPSKSAYREKQRTQAAFERSKYIYNGIDRVDTTRGYFTDNCVTCCLTCNKAKGQLSLREFEAYLTQLVKFRGAK